VESYSPEDQVLVDARARAVSSGAVPVSPATGAALAMIAGLLNASSVAEIGTGAGVSGLWLLRGMRPDGVLTSVDDDGEQHRAARETFAASGVTPQRVRLITGRALDVVSRLTDGGYDLVVIDADPLELDSCVDEARRLLRVGGALVVVHSLAANTVADAAQRDAVTSAIRAVVARLADSEQWSATMLPVGDGLLVALRNPDQA
jgi:predicted O-methyltransferase YrrM